LCTLLPGRSKTLKLHLHPAKMMISNGAHDKLATLRAYFYLLRRGVRGADAENG